MVAKVHASRDARNTWVYIRLDTMNGKNNIATTQPIWPPRIQRSKPAAATPSSTPPASPPHPATPLIHTNPTPLPSHAPYAHRSRDAAPMPLHFHQTQPPPHTIHPSATHRRPHTDTPYTSVCTPTAHTPSPAYASSLPASGARTTSQTTRRAPQTARVRPHHTRPSVLRAQKQTATTDPKGRAHIQQMRM